MLTIILLNFEIFVKPLLPSFGSHQVSDHQCLYLALNKFKCCKDM